MSFYHMLGALQETSRQPGEAGTIIPFTTEETEAQAS